MTRPAQKCGPNLNGTFMAPKGLSQVLQRLQDVVNDAGAAVAWAEKHGFSESYISRVRSGEKLPSERLCLILGFRVHRTVKIVHEYEWIGRGK